MALPFLEIMRPARASAQAATPQRFDLYVCLMFRIDRRGHAQMFGDFLRRKCFEVVVVHPFEEVVDKARTHIRT